MGTRSGVLRWRTRWSVCGAVVLLAAACLAVLFAGSGDDANASHDVSPDVPPLLEIEHDGLRYVFHVTTGSEALYDLATDPDARSNVAEERPEDTLRLRGVLADEHAVEDLDTLRGEYQDRIDELRRLGYL